MDYTNEQIAKALIDSDPNLWASTYLRDVNDPSKPLTLWKHQQEILEYQPQFIKENNLWVNKNRVIRAGRGAGKCRYIHDYLTLADGQRITFKQLLEMNMKGSHPAIFTCDRYGKVIKTIKYRIAPNGKQSLYKIRTKTGTEEISTANHPYMTYTDYGVEFLELENFKKGLSILNIRFIPVFGENLEFKPLTEETIDHYFIMDYNLCMKGLKDFILDKGKWDYNRHSINIVGSDIFLQKLKHFLTRFGIVGIHEDGILYIRDYNARGMFITLGLNLIPRMKDIFDKLLPEPNFDILNNLFLDSVDSVKFFKYDDTVDLTVEDTNIIVSDLPSHNTVALTVDALWYALTRPYSRVLIVTPRQSHVETIIGTMKRVFYSSSLSYMKVRDRQNPTFLLEFSNGSTIEAITAGVGGPQSGTTVRSKSGDRIYLDESDYMDDAGITAVLPIMNRFQHTAFWASSTPTGKRKQFYIWCTRAKELGFKEYYWPSQISPNWSSVQEKIFKSSMSAIEYDHEINADWGNLAEGVFSTALLDGQYDEETGKYVIHPAICDISQIVNNFPFGSRVRLPGWEYFIGVDWNAATLGSHFVVMAYNGRQLLTQLVVVTSDPTDHNLKSLQELIELNSIFQPRKIHCDAGYGETKQELISKYGKDRPESKLLDRVEFIPFQGNIEVFDKSKGTKIQKLAKPFMVNSTVKLLELKKLKIDKGLDTGETSLPTQMRDYSVTYGTSGRPTYFRAGQGGYDHTLDALMLACLSFVRTYDLYSLPDTPEIIAVANFLEQKPNVDKKKDEKDASINWGSMQRRNIPGGRSW